MQAGTTAAFGDVDALNFGVSTPSAKLSHVLITRGPGPCTFHLADETGC